MFNSRLSSTTNQTRRDLYNTYGYVCNQHFSLWQNKLDVLANTPTAIYFAIPQNMSYHNLCEKYTIPIGSNNLLGLSHKFIPQRYKPKNTIEKSLAAFHRDARLRYFFRNQDPPEDSIDETPKKLYIKSDWEPPLGNSILESKLTNFSNALRDKYTAHKPKRNINLNKVQLNTLAELKNSRDIIVLLADKNLGPVLMDRDKYINRIYSEHLNDTTTYQPIEKFTALHTMNELRNKLRLLLLKHPTSTKPSSSTPYTSKKFHLERTYLEEYEKLYLGSALYDKTSRTPVFYGLIKVHKNPWKVRPVVSCSGSLLAYISTWIDHKLQRFKHHIKSYIRDSEDLQSQLEQLYLPPHDIKIGTSDAVSMYTNIDTAHNITTVREWLTSIQNYLPAAFPIDIIIEAIKIVMENNIFTFGNKYYLQKTGTAMGTPCACILATIYFSLHEDYLLMKYKKHILFYKRFIDDCFYIWNMQDNHLIAQQQFSLFKKDMDQHGLLRWTHTPLSNRTNFLDLTITYNPTLHKLHFKTFQKPENLYLYIPPNSAHPPGVIKSLIFGLLRKYKLQNSSVNDFNNIKNKLFARLLARGHSQKDILPIFKEALLKIHTTNQKPPNKTKNSNNTLFFKLLYQPKNISRNFIQSSFHKYCSTPYEKMKNEPYDSDSEDTTDILANTSLTVAYSRDKNLRDLLIPTNLKNI